MKKIEATRTETLCVGNILIFHIEQAIDLSSENPMEQEK